MNRRSFLTRFGAAAFAAPGALAAATKAGVLKTVSVIHTTDLHGHILPTKDYDGFGNLGGLARAATLIRRWRTENPASLLVDVGDLYQGTAVSQISRGDLMVQLLNQLNYDAWVLGNHDFDWGRPVVEGALSRAGMPVLASNVKFSGQWPGSPGATGPLSRLAPFVLKDVGGFKVAIVGSVTPGLASWLHPKILQDIEAVDPLEPARAAIRTAVEQGAQAIVLAGHMGFKSTGVGQDDFANRVLDLMDNLPDVDVFIGGHTHRDLPWVNLRGRPYTQASYYGVHLGRIDLAFDAEKGKLADVRVMTVRMDDRYALDPAILATAKKDLDVAAMDLARPLTALSGPLSGATKFGVPSGQQRLLFAAVREALAKKGEKIDGLLHGSFTEEEWAAGPKTVADVWELLPYENFLVTALLTVEQLRAILNESAKDERSGRNLLGFTTSYTGPARAKQLESLLSATGTPLDPAVRFRIAINTYDAQSGGQRLPQLKAILAEPACATTFHPVETRGAVIEYLANHPTLAPTDLPA